MAEQVLFTEMNTRRYIALTTFRKSGIPVVTPVWFVKEGEKLVIWTAKDSGKAKRLGNNPSVQLGPSDHGGNLLGATVDGKARFLPSGDHPAWKKAFRAKYGWQERLFTVLWKIQGHQHTYIEITPPGS
jgi:PPOX class probable F420-dependent enzyme